jgi:4-amino-4-deoxy-L-arabinose transferase-like glycosyltransferase
MPRTRFVTPLLLPVILLLAATLRLIGNDWDGYNHYHPDERYITWVGTTIAWPERTADFWQPHLSPLNPYYWPPGARSPGIVVEQDQPRDFAYGHLPLYLGVGAMRLVQRLLPAESLSAPPPELTHRMDGEVRWTDFHFLAAIGRYLSALIDVGSVWLLYHLGRRLWSAPVGLLAAALLALNVQHIQLAHFFTFDPYMTFFALAALTAMVAAVQEAGARRGAGPRRALVWLAVAGMAAGMAIGSKFNGIMLGLPLLVAAWWVVPPTLPLRGKIGRFALTLLLIAGAALAAFALTNPYALLDHTCESGAPGPLAGSCFLYNVGKQGGMARGSADFPFARQYSDTLPFLYFIEMQLRWGMGLLPGLAALGGFAFALWRGLRRLLWQTIPPFLTVRPAERGIWLVLLWVVPLFVTTGTFFVKFMRYFQPLVPFLLLFAAAGMMAIPRRRLRHGAIGVVMAAALVWAGAFVTIYRTPHPWITASLWLYENAPAGAQIAWEQWGDRLPSSVQQGDVRFSARAMGYNQPALTWLTRADSRDNEEKLLANLTILAQSDFLVVDSNRIYGVTPRLPQRYPLSGQAPQLLFDGALGYELVFVAGRRPQIGPLALQADLFSWPGLTPPAGVQAYLEAQPVWRMGRVDESFVLYDQPLVMVFANTERLSVEQLRTLFR